MQSEKLKLLGFNESVRGVLYMDSALQIIESGKPIRIIDLYSKLASEFLTNPENISSGIRYAINKWWSTAPDSLKRKHFQINYNLGTPPTNKTFLTYVVNENVSVFKES